MRVGSLIWGFIVLLLGIIFLGINLDWWNSSVLFDLFSLWPVIILLIGVKIIFGHNYLLSAIISLLILIGVVVFLFSPNPAIRKFSRVSTTQTENDTISRNLENGVQKASLEIDFGAGNLNVKNAPENNLLYNAVLGSNGGRLTESYSLSNGEVKVKLSETMSRSFFGNRRTLDLEVNSSVPLSLKVNSGASNIDLNLRELTVTNLDLNAGASSGKIVFGDKVSSVTAEIDAGASNMEIDVPSGTGIKVVSSSALMSNNFESIGLQKSGDTFTSNGFDQSKKQILLTIKAGASSFKIARY